MASLSIFGLASFLIAVSHGQEIRDLEVVAGVSTNINIRCNLEQQEATPFWIINELIYSPFRIPYQFLPDSLVVIPEVNSFSVLTIPRITVALNQTTFQCATYNDNGIIRGNGTRLIVHDQGGIIITIDQDIAPNMIVFDYMHLDVEPGAVTLQWTYEEPFCSPYFELEGFTLANLSPNNLTTPINIIRSATNASMVSIPSDGLTTSAGDPIYYRLVAKRQNGTICSHSSTKMTYYRFNTSHILETTVLGLNQNGSACFPLPNIPDNVPHGGGCLYFILASSNPQNCDCPAYRDARFAMCACIQNSSVSLEYNRTERSICVHAPQNNTVIHYQCTDRPCAGCYVNTILESHKIILAGPPDAPDVSLNASSLCLSVYSRPELPVLYFDVVVMDVTGIPSNLTGRHNVTSGNTVCLPITSNPTPNICSQVIATATNTIGTSSNTTTNVPCMEIAETTTPPRTLPTTSLPSAPKDNGLAIGLGVGLSLLFVLIIVIAIIIIIISCHFRKKSCKDQQEGKKESKDGTITTSF